MRLCAFARAESNQEIASQDCDGELSRHTVNAETPKPNGSDAASSPPPPGQKSRVKRTLFTAGVFALLAMIYVPYPRERGVHSAGYRFIFSGEDTSIAFFQLLYVGFAALFGAILATIVAKMSKRARWVSGCILVVAIVVVAIASFAGLRNRGGCLVPR